MTDAPKPPEPADPAAPRPRLPPSFWVMIAFTVVCILAGVVIGRYGARLFPAKPPLERAASARLASPPRPAK